MAKYIDLPNLKENLTNFLNKKINPIYAKKTEIPSNVSELNNDKSYQTAEEVGQAVTDGVARIVAGAPEDFDTLKEMSDWISSHETSAAAMNSAISDNSVAIANHTSNSDIHVTKEEKTKWNKLDSNLKDGTIIVAEATKATQDAQGNVIDTTYAKKAEIPQGTVVDDALSSTSTNPVQNKVVKAEFDQVNSNLDTLEHSDVAGGKNICKASDKGVINEITLIKKDVSTIIISGASGSRAISNNFNVKKGVIYTATFFTSSTNVTGFLWDNIKENLAYHFGSSKTFTFTPTEDLTLCFAVTLTATVSNVEISMQVEEGSKSTSFEPYIPSVKMLAEENAQQSIEAMDLKMLGWSVPKECPVQNEVNGNQFVQKVGRYNLWEFSWGFVPKEDAWGAPYYYCYLSGLLPKMPDSHDGVPNMFCQKYKVVSWNAMGSGIDDTICLIYTANSIRIKDTTYTNLADFKQAMQGQYLYYELATPITKIIDGNEKSEQIDDSLTSLGKCKNLLNPTLQTTTQNGVTCTNNGDGTYTFNGTATGKTVFTFQYDITLDIGNYVINSINNLWFSIEMMYEPYTTYGGTFTNKQFYVSSKIQNIKACVTIDSGLKFSNVVFKPMLTTNLNATYDDFVPYTGDGDTLTADVADIKNDLNTKANIADPVFTGSFSQNRAPGSPIGTNSHAEGEYTKASGNTSHAEGIGTEASGEGSHAEGEFTIVSGNGSHAEGTGTIASGEGSHAEGYNAEARGESSHAEGHGTIASGNTSHAEGTGTEASNFASHAAGKYNASMITGGAPNNTTGTAFVIGNGTSSKALSNAFSVQYDGTVKAKSTITASTTADYSEFFEWLDENPDNEDRVGYFVTLDGNRIKIASDNDDYILGIVSGEPFVLGNGDCDTWNGMYLHDEFRRTIYEPAPKVEEVEIKEEREETYIDEETGEEKTRTVEVVVGHEFKEVEGEFDGTRPKLNPEYDNTQQYISRFDRKEWSPVGMLGVLAVRHDGTAKVNGYVTVNKDGIATACDRNIENSYRVIKANTDSVVEVIFK